jgi:hypothetical protein
MSINVPGIYAVASHFKERYLHPLQFAKPHGNNSQPKTSAPNTSAPKQGSDAHFDNVMSRSAALLDRTKLPTSTTWGEQMGQRLGEKHDRVEAADHARAMRRSGDILQNIRNTQAEHRAWSPLPEERHEDAMKRSGDTLGRIRASQARVDAMPSAPAAPQPSASRAQSFYNQNEDHGWTAQVGSFKPSGKSTPDAPLKPKVTPVSNPEQFQQSNYRQAATMAAPPSRTYHAPEPTPFTPPAGQAAPQRPLGGVGKGRQNAIPKLPAKSTFAKGKPVAPRAEETPAHTPAGPGKGQLPLWSDEPAAPAKRPQAKKAAPTPSKPTVSDSEWGAMLNDSVAEHKASKATAKPAPATSKSSNVRETTVKVGGKERVVRTEHNGSQAQLESKHTKAVKGALEELRAPKVKEAEQRLAYGVATGAKKSMIAAHKKEVREAKNPPTNPTHSDAFREAYKKHPKVQYDAEVPEHLKPFMGDGTDDPGQSHYYGIGKK